MWVFSQIILAIKADVVLFTMIHQLIKLQVKAMLARDKAENSLDTSAHASGLVCGDLLMKCRIVFDYARRRFAVTQILR